MKKKSKIVISLAAGMLALSGLGMMPVYAEPSAAETAAQAQHTITIRNTPKGGATYNAYKVFDETHDGEATTYTIEGDSAFYDTVSAYDGIKLTKAPGTTDTYVVTKTDKFDAPTFAGRLLADATKPAAAGTVTTADGADGTITVTGEGYYYVNTETGTLASLDSTNDTATVVDKNRDIFTEDDDGDGHLNFYTEADDHSVEESQIVNYTAHSVIPATVGYGSYTYTIKVSNNNGMTIDKDSIKIAYDGGEASATVPGFTVAKGDDNSFTVTIDTKTLNGDTGMAALGKKFDITYSAKNVLGNGYGGSVDTVLTHSTDPNDASATEAHNSSDKFYTGEIFLNKLDGDKSTQGHDVYLAGAKFVLANADGTKFYKVSEDRTVTWITADDAEKAAAAGATVYTSKSGTYAPIVIGGLEANDTSFPNDPSKLVGNASDARGKYKLYEIAAPAGYNMLTEPVDVTLEYNEGHLSTAYVDAKNYSGTEMPQSGGAGTAMIYMIGTLVAASGVIYVVSKRKKKTA